MLGASLAPVRCLRAKQVTAKLGIGISTLYDLLNPKSAKHDPTFPKPISIARNAVAWLEHELDTWLGTRAAVRDRTPPTEDPRRKRQLRAATTKRSRLAARVVDHGQPRSTRA